MLAEGEEEECGLEQRTVGGRERPKDSQNEWSERPWEAVVVEFRGADGLVP